MPWKGLAELVGTGNVKFISKVHNLVYNVKQQQASGTGQHSRLSGCEQASSFTIIKPTQEARRTQKDPCPSPILFLRHPLPVSYPCSKHDELLIRNVFVSDRQGTASKQPREALHIAIDVPVGTFDNTGF